MHYEGFYTKAVNSSEILKEFCIEKSKIQLS